MFVSTFNSYKPQLWWFPELWLPQSLGFPDQQFWMIFLGYPAFLDTSISQCATIEATHLRNGWTCREELMGLSREYMEKVLEAHVPCRGWYVTDLGLCRGQLVIPT